MNGDPASPAPSPSINSNTKKAGDPLSRLIASRGGLEPPQQEPESCVLPLHNREFSTIRNVIQHAPCVNGCSAAQLAVGSMPMHRASRMRPIS